MFKCFSLLCSSVNLSKHNIYALFGRLKQFFSCFSSSIYDAPFCYLVEYPIYAFSKQVKYCLFQSILQYWVGYRFRFKNQQQQYLNYKFSYHSLFPVAIFVFYSFLNKLKETINILVKKVIYFKISI